MLIKETHAKMMQSFDIINRFLDENYYNKKRRTFKELARKLKIKETEVKFALPYWLSFLPRHDSRNERIYKLAVFLTDDNRSIETLRYLELTKQERAEIFQASRSFDMPSITYVKAYQYLLVTLNGEEGVKDIKNQIINAWATTARSLEAMGLVKYDDIINDKFFSDQAWKDILTPIQDYVNQQQPCFSNDEITIRPSWGRYTFEKHAEISAPQKHEVICLAPKGESSEERVYRQAACQRLNDFVKSMSLFGLELVSVSNNLVFNSDTGEPERKNNPRLNFISGGSAMAEMSILFENLGQHGKFIIN